MLESANTFSEGYLKKRFSHFSSKSPTPTRHLDSGRQLVVAAPVSATGADEVVLVKSQVATALV